MSANIATFGGYFTADGDSTPALPGYGSGIGMHAPGEFVPRSITNFGGLTGPTVGSPL